jgi:type IV pilus assembly protein PilO
MSAINRLSQRDQFIVLGVLVLVLCVVFYIYMIGPMRTEIETVKGEIATLEAEISQTEVLNQRLQTIKLAVAEQQARLNELRQVLPEEKETADIIRQVQELAVESQLRIKSFTPRSTVDNVFYQDWPILISLEGNFDSLGIFFEKISGFTRIINVEDISIQALDTPTRNRTLSATCTATTFVFIETPLEEDGEEGQS